MATDEYHSCPKCDCDARFRREFTFPDGTKKRIWLCTNKQCNLMFITVTAATQRHDSQRPNVANEAKHD